MESNGLPISIRTSPANQHDSTKFIDVLENISDFLNDDLIHAIVSAYADKGYDAAYIRNYLRCYGINCCIPYKKNSKTVSQNKNQKYYGKTRFVVERFFAWLKCGFHRTTIRYEDWICLLASILMIGDYELWICLLGINSNVLESFRMSCTLLVC